MYNDWQKMMIGIYMVLILDGSSEYGAVFRFVEGIWLHQMSRQIQFFWKHILRYHLI